MVRYESTLANTPYTYKSSAGIQETLFFPVVSWVSLELSVTMQYEIISTFRSGNVKVIVGKGDCVVASIR